MLLKKWLIWAFAASTALAPVNAQTPNYCTTGASGKIVVNFSVKPSLVAHSDAVLDTGFAAGDSAGDPGESLFSFKRTIGALLTSAESANTPQAREVLVESMIKSFTGRGGKALNADAGVFMALEERLGESGLTAQDLLNPASATGLRPLALFNRFDLAPADFAHCGEYRIVYGKGNPGFTSRFLLIFEAAMPNPGTGEAGCKPITEFWAGLSGTDEEIARKLASFYYDGKTDPGLAAPDLPSPVVHYKNYGGDGVRGQVRGNLFMQPPWQLREWLTQRTFAANGSPLEFVSVTVKDNPLAELYKDEVTSEPALAGNIPAAVNLLHGQFVQSFAADIHRNLMSEGTAKYKALVEDLDKFDLGTGNTAAVTEEDVLLATIALSNAGRFNEHQGVSQGEEDKPSVLAGPTFRAVIGGLPQGPDPKFPSQNADQILARAGAVTCGGCHRFAVGDTVRVNADGTSVVWPSDQVPFPGRAFVHVDEDRNLSPALEEAFLPFRRYVLARHLCGTGAPVVASAAEAVPVPSFARSMRFVDNLTSEGATAVIRDAKDVMTELSALPRETRRAVSDALRARIRAEIDQAREAELQFPGAFVEQRRPH